ncbi:hypothetical protein M231_02043 [Tremella mesenterica]|uniref:Calpain catalytic domain-containing protein n=1 Tax=Tremella mesenterica TaxID=5217 RepID=A0A4Q1BRJ3_TREME|nr:hypothetical protein M231_02043 [Tremella mesenterica]
MIFSATLGGVVLAILGNVEQVSAINATAAGPVYVPGGLDCKDITRDQMVTMAPFEESVTMDDLAAAMCSIVHKNQGWITKNVYTPGGKPDTQLMTGFVLAQPESLQPQWTNVTLPASDPEGVVGVPGTNWWPYGYKVSYYNLWTFKGQASGCDNALEAVTGFDATTEYPDLTSDTDKAELLNMLRQHVDSSPILLGMSASNKLLGNSECVAALTTGWDGKTLNVTIYDNYNTARTFNLDDIWSNLESWTHLTNWDVFGGAPIGNITFPPMPAPPAPPPATSESPSITPTTTTTSTSVVATTTTTTTTTTTHGGGGGGGGGGCKRDIWGRVRCI